MVFPIADATSCKWRHEFEQSQGTCKRDSLYKTSVYTLDNNKSRLSQKNASLETAATLFLFTCYTYKYKYTHNSTRCDILKEKRLDDKRYACWLVFPAVCILKHWYHWCHTQIPAKSAKTLRAYVKRTLKESLAAETVEFAASDSKVMLSMKFGSHFPSVHGPPQNVNKFSPSIAEQSLSVVQVVGHLLSAWTDRADVKKSTKARIQTAGAPKSLVNIVWELPVCNEQ